MVDGWGVVASLSLIAVTVGLSMAWRLELHRPLIIAAARALVQLLAVGIILVPVLQSEAPLIWSWSWVSAMVALAVAVVRRRTRDSAPHRPSVATVTAGVGAPLVVCLVVVFGLGVFPLRPITLVPIAGIVLGNSLPVTVAAAKRFEDQVRTDRGQIEAMLALGFGPRAAIRRTVQTAIRDSLLPQIERTNVVGLVALPGAM
ncbi:MAG: ABC transporter permease, partial [Actinomycetota bacterium]|nr:ABC transporter permease [Actinomycetota bacterium]